jgi:hypothetical protein
MLDSATKPSSAPAATVAVDEPARFWKQRMSGEVTDVTPELDW